MEFGSKQIFINMGKQDYESKEYAINDGKKY